MAKSEKLAPSEGGTRRSGGSKDAPRWLSVRSVLIGAVLVGVGAIGGGVIDHRMRDEGLNPMRPGAMASMMDDDHGMGGPQMGGPQMGGKFGGERRGQIAGTVVSVAGDKLTLNTVNGNVIFTIASGTTYTSTATASAADLVAGASVRVRLDRGSPMQAGEILISK